MRLLLDTHVLIWWIAKSVRISAPVTAVLEDAASEIYVSSISAFEIAQKRRLGKLNFDDAFLHNFDARVRGLNFRPLLFSADQAARAGQLVGLHKDPFDRMLAAQSIVEQMPIATIDPAFKALGASVVW